MGNDCRFMIPEQCRSFSARSLDEIRSNAKSFIESFVQRVAPQKKHDDSNLVWTRSIRQRFIELCPDGCYPLPESANTAKGEYLVDYTWTEKENGKRVLLAAESEWGREWLGPKKWSLVEHDFEKLLAVKAPIKVLIFSSCRQRDPTWPEGTNFSIEFAKGRLMAALGNYWHHLAGEAYVFIDFPETGDPNSDGEYESFMWIAEKAGGQEIRLEDGPKGNLIRPT